MSTIFSAKFATSNVDVTLDSAFFCAFLKAYDTLKGHWPLLTEALGMWGSIVFL